jgi:hypothetical protein
MRRASNLKCSVARIAVPLVVGLAALALAFSAAPALAAETPEAPELKVEAIKAHEATLHAVINPKVAVFPVEAGAYHFVYKAGASCVGGIETTSDAYAGLAPEEFFEPIASLTANTEYAVCEVVETLGGGEAEVATTFKTAIPPETPFAEKVKAGSITATTAEVEGELNPTKARTSEPGTFEVIYKVSPLAEAPTGQCEESFTPGPPVSGALHEAVGPLKLEGLQPNAKYTFCLRAHNEAGEEATGAPVTFNTSPVPAEIVSESVSNIKATEATLEGAVNPTNQFTECHFQYGLVVTENTIPCTPELLKGFGGQEVNPKKVNERGETVPAPITGLTANTEYHYWIVTKNGDGEVETGKEEHFTTAFPPEEPVKPTAPEPAVTGVTTTSAMLHGVLNPTVSHESEPGSYEFVYRRTLAGVYQRSPGECRYVLSAEEATRLEAEIAAAGLVGDNAKAKEKEAKLEADRAKEAENEHTTQELATGATPEAVQSEAMGLLPGGVTYIFCLLARNAAGEEALGPQETFTTGAIAPVIVGEPQSGATVSSLEVTNQTSSTADLTALVNPKGAETTYVMDYGTSTDYSSSTPPANIPAGGLPVAISQEITGLKPNTTYHWRLVVKNAEGKAESADHTFDYAVSEEPPAPVIATSGETTPPAPGVTVPGKQYEELGTIATTLLKEAEHPAETGASSIPPKPTKCKKGVRHACVKKKKHRAKKGSVRKHRSKK